MTQKHLPYWAQLQALMLLWVLVALQTGARIELAPTPTAIVCLGAGWSFGILSGWEIGNTIRAWHMKRRAIKPIIGTGDGR